MTYFGDQRSSVGNIPEKGKRITWIFGEFHGTRNPQERMGRPRTFNLLSTKITDSWVGLEENLLVLISVFNVIQRNGSALLKCRFYKPKVSWCIYSYSLLRPPMSLSSKVHSIDSTSSSIWSIIQTITEYKPWRETQLYLCRLQWLIKAEKNFPIFIFMDLNSQWRK